MSTEVEQQQQQPKQQQLEWRRGRVLELSSQGRTEREIAPNRMQVSFSANGTLKDDMNVTNAGKFCEYF